VSDWYPILLNLKGRDCVIIGGGAVAERKARGLLDAGAHVRIVSPMLTPGLTELLHSGAILWQAREYTDGDLEGAKLAFAATDRPETNASVISEARSSGIPANAADGDTEGDFIVPAVLRRGELMLTVSASGAGPAVAARIIGELSARYGPEYERYLAQLRKIRTIVRAEVSDPRERRKLLAAAATEEALVAWSCLDIDALERRDLLEKLRVRSLHGKG
jgi:precorrin-2 dehydrogenase/sirohydrochlorin ferrochelatase